MVTKLLLQNEHLQLVPDSASLTGNPACAGIFSGGRYAVPDDGPYGVIHFPESGVAISTGDPHSLNMQSTDRMTTFMNAAGDADLDLIVNGPTKDACALSFKFYCTASPCDISFEYIWGSEEYTEFVASNFNDAFAWFLNGENIAIVPGTKDTPVSIDTINDNVNSQFFINNDVTDNPSGVPYPMMEADGFTRPLNANGRAIGGTVLAPGLNDIKLVVADRSDAMFDSWALFTENSFYVKPPKVGGGGGDPHFLRWGNDHRDSFHGECDLVVFHSDKFNHEGLDFHVRTTIFDDLYSYIESAALRLGDSIVEVHNGHVLLNGVKHDESEMPLEFGQNKKYKFEVTKVEGSRRSYRLALDNDSGIDFKFYKGMMTFGILGHPHFENGSGLLGAYPSGEMLSRAGEPMKNFIDFGFEWQVNAEDVTLFQDARMPQLPYERCRMPSRTAESSRRRLRGNRKLMEAAENACSHVKGRDFTLCVDDVVMTGDVELAHEW